MTVCPECFMPLIASTSRPGVMICPNDWRDCPVAGRALEVVGR